MPYRERLAEAYIQAASKQREEAASSADQPLSPALQETVKRLGEQVPTVKIPDPNIMQDHKDRRIAELERQTAELERQTDKSFSGELMKKMAPIVTGAAVGSGFGAPWGILAGAVAGAASETIKMSTSEDPLNQLPEQSNGLGRYIP